MQFSDFILDSSTNGSAIDYTRSVKLIRVTIARKNPQIFSKTYAGFRMSQYCRNLLKIYVNLLYIAGHAPLQNIIKDVRNTNLLYFAGHAPLQNIIKDMSDTQTYFILLVMLHFKT